jgi:hypothetical protein
MGHAIENMSLEIDNAVERLITKLILLDQNMVGTAQIQERAMRIDTFLSKYEDFIHKRGSYGRNYIWVIAAEEDIKAYQ